VDDSLSLGKDRLRIHVNGCLTAGLSGVNPGRKSLCVW